MFKMTAATTGRSSVKFISGESMNIDRENPYSFKISKKKNRALKRQPTYVLLLPAKLKRCKIALCDLNCIRLLGKDEEV
jgi:hypothetical protein